jgi:hypothetical protein
MMMAVSSQYDFSHVKTTAMEIFIYKRKYKRDKKPVCNSFLQELINQNLTTSTLQHAKPLL